MEIAILFLVAGVLSLLAALLGRRQTIIVRVQAPPRERVRLVTDQYPGEDPEAFLERHADRAHRLGLDDRARWTPGEVRFGRRPGV